MKTRIPSILVILAIPVIIISLFIFGVGSLVNWKVKAASDDADKASLANQALMPGMADYVERYGMRGFQDVDLQVETCKFSSLDELYAALPSGSENAISNALSSEPVSTSDVKGKAVKQYTVDSLRPCESTKTSLHTDVGRIEEDSQTYDWRWEYYVYEYYDGTYRFAVLISPM